MPRLWVLELLVAGENWLPKVVPTSIGVGGIYTWTHHTNTEQTNKQMCVSHWHSICLTPTKFWFWCQFLKVCKIWYKNFNTPIFLNSQIFPIFKEKYLNNPGNFEKLKLTPYALKAQAETVFPEKSLPACWPPACSGVCNSPSLSAQRSRILP